jgi:hypothetical protein
VPRGAILFAGGVSKLPLAAWLSHSGNLRQNHVASRGAIQFAGGVSTLLLAAWLSHSGNLRQNQSASFRAPIRAALRRLSNHNGSSRVGLTRSSLGAPSAHRGRLAATAPEAISPARSRPVLPVDRVGRTAWNQRIRSAPIIHLNFRSLLELWALDRKAGIGDDFIQRY